jgi:hypothetical protein
MKLRDFETSGYHSIAIDQIDKIRLHRKGKLWRSALIGLGTGALVGALIGNLSYNDNAGGCWICFSKAESTTLGASGFGLTGALVGTFVGLPRIRIPINGKASDFKANQNRLIKYSYKKGTYSGKQ